jgi:hypothetical protein
MTARQHAVKVIQAAAIQAAIIQATGWASSPVRMLRK